MNRNVVLIGAGIIGALALIFLMSALFTVHQTQQALVLQFGNPKRVIQEPGLHVKLPWQNAVYVDSRVLDFDAAAEEVILGDQKRLVVDAFTRYKIVDPLRFYQTVGDETRLRGRIDTILDASLRKTLGEVPLFTVLSEDRGALMDRIKAAANQEAQQFGIDIVDVRIKRADLPAENSQAIYRRMQTEREREAKELRAQGAELAQRIRSRADRERRVIIAEAQKEAQIIRGEGDGQKTAIFADAFGQDIDFFEFYRSMQAYRDALGDANTSFVLSPDSEFFRYFGGTAVSGAADGAGGSIQPGSGGATPPQQQSDAGGSAAPATPAGATSGEDDAEEVDAQADATGSAAVVQQGATRPSSVVD